MPDIGSRRVAFAAGLQRTLSSPDERQRFMRILDDLISWSTAQGSLLSLREEYDQGVVAFGRAIDGVVVWSAYPKERDGAKLDILPRSASKQSPVIQQQIDTTLLDIGAEPRKSGCPVMIPFLKLKNAAKFDRVRRLLTDIAEMPA